MRTCSECKQPRPENWFRPRYLVEKALPDMCDDCRLAKKHTRQEAAQQQRKLRKAGLA